MARRLLKINLLKITDMKTKKRILKSCYTEISDIELSEIRAGTIPVAVAALVLATGKLVLETSYYLGYAIGYIQVKYQ